MGVVEGITEFLPISSTGHLILVGSLLNFNDDKGKAFEIAIQSGAILAVCWEYRIRLITTLKGFIREPQQRRFAINLLIAFTPAAILGLFFHTYILAHLFRPLPVALAFILGGFIILWAEKRTHVVHVHSVDDITLKTALMLGFVQAIALIPGTSRSGATIVGGLLLGLSRRAATEFSFFLAIPTLFAATGYELIRMRQAFSPADMPGLVIGFVAAFFSARLVVRWLLRYIAHNDFTVFAWYRIAFGMLVLCTAYFGWIDWSH